mmetsp:Transcript_7913/g.15264  ORF Transcript_7913/g.15264 Transcript_7913/m.15264 type:complete len:350 (+) Transcript_7913:1024-2073(+)
MCRTVRPASTRRAPSKDSASRQGTRCCSRSRPSRECSCRYRRRRCGRCISRCRGRAAPRRRGRGRSLLPSSRRHRRSSPRPPSPNRRGTGRNRGTRRCTSRDRCRGWQRRQGTRARRRRSSSLAHTCTCRCRWGHRSTCHGWGQSTTPHCSRCAGTGCCSPLRSTRGHRRRSGRSCCSARGHGTPRSRRSRRGRAARSPRGGIPQRSRMYRCRWHRQSMSRARRTCCHPHGGSGPCTPAHSSPCCRCTHLCRCGCHRTGHCCSRACPCRPGSPSHRTCSMFQEYSHTFRCQSCPSCSCHGHCSRRKASCREEPQYPSTGTCTGCTRDLRRIPTRPKCSMRRSRRRRIHR